jgi:carbonic anhydrase
MKGEHLSRDHVTRRGELVSGQQPFAGIITCSDSRISPEYIFDAWLGELFVVRNAGNVVDVNALASMEYAVQHLGVEFIVVLGHEMCGAVNAACSSEYHEGNLARLMEDLGESVRRGGGDPARVVVENVRLSMERLRFGSGHLRSRMEGGNLTVKGALYSLDTGVVRWLD